MNIYLNCLKKYKELSCYTYPFPTGRLYIFGDKNSIKLVQFGFGIDHKRDIEKKYKSTITDEIGKAIEFLDRYLVGENGVLPGMDFSGYSEKEKNIYDELIKVKFGNTVSYKELSEHAGIANGARFAGNTMAKNLFPVFVPCHRVINSNGIIGNFSAGREIKKFLLHHEKTFNIKSKPAKNRNKPADN